MKRKMRVLLLGEFSGVHNNLKKGLTSLGLDVTLANTGDGYKKFSTDINLFRTEKKYIDKYLNFIHRKVMLYRMMKYDVVQFIHPNVLYNLGYSCKDIFRLIKKVKVSVCLLCGCDNAFYDYYHVITPELCKQCQKIDMKGNRCAFSSKVNPEYAEYEKKFYQMIGKLVPLSWEYEYIWREYVRKYNSKLVKLTPMPIDIEAIKPSYEMNDKIKIYHPLNRRGFKGTDEIGKAFQILQEKYRNDVEFLIKGRMPIDEFNRLLSCQDVVVDQMYGATTGMTALYAMAQRKVVVTGFHSDSLDYKKYKYLKELPKVDLGTTVDEMVEVIDELISRKERIEEIKDAGRAYVEKYHESKKVAKRFLRIYMGKE